MKYYILYTLFLDCVYSCIIIAQVLIVKFLQIVVLY